MIDLIEILSFDATRERQDRTTKRSEVLFFPFFSRLFISPSFPSLPSVYSTLLFHFPFLPPPPPIQYNTIANSQSGSRSGGCGAKVNTSPQPFPCIALLSRLDTLLNSNVRSSRCQILLPLVSTAASVTFRFPNPHSTWCLCTLSCTHSCTLMHRHALSHAPPT